MVSRAQNFVTSLRSRNYLIRTALLAGMISAIVPFASRAQHMLTPASPSTAEAVRPNSFNIVIGFMGGMVKRDEPNRSEALLAAKLRDDYSNFAYVDTYQNARWKDARTKILTLLDTDHDGKLSEEEKQKRESFCTATVGAHPPRVTLARDLRSLGIPVLLTVQVDSVRKMGQKDDVIPTNVAEAMNFFQPDGMLHGRKLIRAENPDKRKSSGTTNSATNTRRSAARVIRGSRNFLPGNTCISSATRKSGRKLNR